VPTRVRTSSLAFITMRTGTTNPELQAMIVELQKATEPLWKRIAGDLQRPSRQRRIVNLARINRYSKEDETVIIPGKVLGAGSLDHKVNICAWQFSKSAREKIMENGSTIVPVAELIKQGAKGKRLRIIG